MTSPSYTYRAKVVKVTDGDTIRVDLDLGVRVWLHNQEIRLLNVHAHEMTGPDKALGRAAKETLSSAILGKEVVIQTELDKSDKYGRLLGTVWLNGEDINEFMRNNAPEGGR